MNKFNNNKKIKNGVKFDRDKEIITPKVLEHITKKYLAFITKNSIPF